MLKLRLWMLVILACVLPSHAQVSINIARPRIWLTPALVSQLQAKKGGTQYNYMVSRMGGHNTNTFTLGPEPMLLYVIDPVGNLSWGQAACHQAHYAATSVESIADAELATITVSAGVATVTMNSNSPHRFNSPTGATVVVSGATVAPALNGTWSLLATPFSTTTYAFATTAPNGTYNEATLQVQNWVTYPTAGVGQVTGTTASAFNGNSMRWYDTLVDRTYDWDYNACTPKELSDILQWTINLRAYNQAHFALTATTTSVNGSNGSLFPENNINCGFRAWTAEAAVATFDPISNPGATSWLTDPTYGEMAQFQNFVLPMMNNTDGAFPYDVGAGGAWPEGIEYAPEAFQYCFEAMNTWETGTNTSLYSLAPNLISDWVNYTIHATSPAGATANGYVLYEPMPYSDVEHIGFLFTDAYAGMIRATYRAQVTGDTTTAGHGQQWLNTKMPYCYMYPYAPSQGDCDADDYLYRTPGAPTVDYTTDGTPTDWITPTMFISRNDWGTKSQWVGFQATDTEQQHNHDGSGQFQIYSGSTWLTREIEGYGSPSNNQVIDGFTHNTLVTNFFPPAGDYSSDNWQAMNHFVRTPTGYASECTAAYCYALADLTGSFQYFGAYTTSTIAPSQGVLRDFLYLKPNFYVVHDRVQYTAGTSATTTSMIQAMSTPTVVGNTATLPDSSNVHQLTVSVMVPSTPVINVRPQNANFTVIGARVINSNIMELWLDGNTNYPSTLLVTIQGGGINSTQTAITVSATTSQIVNGAYLGIDIGTTNYEAVKVVSGGGTTSLVVTRAQLGTLASAHASGAFAGAAFTTTLTGASGVWASLNGTWSATFPGPYPYSPQVNGGQYDKYRYWVNIPSHGITTQWDQTQHISNELVRNMAYVGGSNAGCLGQGGCSVLRTNGPDYTPYRLDIGSNTFRNQESQLIVMQSENVGTAAIPVTAVTGTGMDGAQVGQIVVAAPSTTTIPSTITYTYTVGALNNTHYVFDLLSSTDYDVNTSVSGQITIVPTVTVNPTTIQTTNAGVLIFVD
jgi:hypothetical protein